MAACASIPLDTDSVKLRVLRREKLMGSGVGTGLAVPYARIRGLTQPVVALGVSRNGIDFDARDGQPVHLICLLLSPLEDARLQQDLLADVTRSLSGTELVAKMAGVQNYTEFLALLKSDGPAGNGHPA